MVVLRAYSSSRLKRLVVPWVLPFILGKCLNMVLTLSHLSDYSSPNTPAKPMLFSDNTLKLSGLFFACHTLINSHTALNVPTSFERTLAGLAA